jgi:hypothetical protein
MEGLPKALLLHADIVANGTSSVDIDSQPDSHTNRLIFAESAWLERRERSSLDRPGRIKSMVRR